MDKKYYDRDQCVYCGKMESKNPDDGAGWWFGADEDADKVCDQCADRLEAGE